MYVAPSDRVEVEPLDPGIFRVRVHYGFMQGPDVPEALAQARTLGLDMNADDTTYFLGRETIVITHRPGMALWREHLFAVMSRNALPATAFFHLPPNRVIELGQQITI